MAVWVTDGFGQAHASFAEIHGRITDPSGASIPAGTVVIRNDNTGQEISVTTNALGEYRSVLLRPGTYEVRAEANGFEPQIKRLVPLAVGQIRTLDFQLRLGSIEPLLINVTETLPLGESNRTQQANTIDPNYIRQLPIDRRDYLTYTLLAPGVADSEALADATDYRVVQNAHSGISFYGNNGRGNSVSVDGGEANDSGGGIRPTLSQEAIQEFQINRSNYSAELGGASGGVINIVSKSGTNFFHGSGYGFFRHQSLDAADPFAQNLVDGKLMRVKPPSNRQQFGATFGGPLKENRTFLFTAFEGIERKESNSIVVLTDPTIFQPTPQQEAILSTLPANAAAPLRQALTSTPATRRLLEMNSGVFPFDGTDYKLSLRIDHQLNTANQFMLRYNTAIIHESNPNAKALLGASRAVETSRLDHNAILSWTQVFSARLANQVHFQFDYGDFLVQTKEKFGPEININGFGFFNRDFFLPSNLIWRRYDVTDGLSMDLGAHLIKVGGQVVFRGNHAESQTTFPGRFNFGELPGAAISPVLASTAINALQAFNLGLPQAYQQGFGDPIVSSTEPLLGIYIQDRWQPVRRLTLDVGLRYDLDDLRDPLPTDKNNFAPRFGFAWQTPDSKATIRGGYGIFYAPTNYAIVHVLNSIGDINGRRQIAQVLTTIQTPGPASASNVYRTLLAQGVITLPTPSRTITRADIAQFGIAVRHDGAPAPLSVSIKHAKDFVSPYSQQFNFGIERELTPDLLLGANYLFVRGLKIVRARDENLLRAPIDPTLGIRVWSPPFFRDPILLQDNVYESTARSWFHGLTVEIEKRFTRRFGLNANYTFSKSIDDVVDFNTDFQAADQTNLQAERAVSSFDQKHKFVLYGSVQGPEPSGGLRHLVGSFTMAPIVRVSSGRPFNLLTGFDLNQDRHATTDRPAFAGRNTGLGPNFWTLDLRLTRLIPIRESSRLELMGEVFNLFNRLNFRSVNNTVGNISPPFDLRGRKELRPSDPLGFTSAFDPRRIQLGLRLSF
jgi:hypothetical protein